MHIQSGLSLKQHTFNHHSIWNNATLVRKFLLHSRNLFAAAEF